MECIKINANSTTVGQNADFGLRLNKAHGSSVSWLKISGAKIAGLFADYNMASSFYHVIAENNLGHGFLLFKDNGNSYTNLVAENNGSDGINMVGNQDIAETIFPGLIGSGSGTIYYNPQLKNNGSWGIHCLNVAGGPNIQSPVFVNNQIGPVLIDGCKQSAISLAPNSDDLTLRFVGKSWHSLITNLKNISQENNKYKINIELGKYQDANGNWIDVPDINIWQDYTSSSDRNFTKIDHSLIHVHRLQNYATQTTDALLNPVIVHVDKAPFVPTEFDVPAPGVRNKKEPLVYLSQFPRYEDELNDTARLQRAIDAAAGKTLIVATELDIAAPGVNITKPMSLRGKCVSHAYILGTKWKAIGAWESQQAMIQLNAPVKMECLYLSGMHLATHGIIAQAKSSESSIYNIKVEQTTEAGVKIENAKNQEWQLLNVYYNDGQGLEIINSNQLKFWKLHLTGNSLNGVTLGGDVGSSSIQFFHPTGDLSGAWAFLLENTASKIDIFSGRLEGHQEGGIWINGAQDVMISLMRRGNGIIPLQVTGNVDAIKALGLAGGWDVNLGYYYPESEAEPVAIPVDSSYFDLDYSYYFSQIAATGEHTINYLPLDE